MSVSRGIQAGLALSDAFNQGRYTRAVSRYERDLEEQQRAAQAAMPRDQQGLMAAEAIGVDDYGPPTPQMDMDSGYAGPTQGFTPPTEMERMQAMRGLAARYNRGDEIQRFDSMIGDIQRREEERAIRASEFDRDFGLRQSQYNLGVSERDRQIAQQNIQTDVSSILNQGLLNNNLSESFELVQRRYGDDPQAFAAATNQFLEQLQGQTGMSVQAIGDMGRQARDTLARLERTTFASPQEQDAEYTRALGDYFDPDLNDGQSVTVQTNPDTGKIEVYLGNAIEVTYNSYEELKRDLRSRIGRDDISFGLRMVSQRQERSRITMDRFKDDLEKAKLSQVDRKQAIDLLDSLQKDPRFMALPKNEQEQFIRERFEALNLPFFEEAGLDDPTTPTPQDGGSADESFFTNLGSKIGGFFGGTERAPRRETPPPQGLVAASQQLSEQELANRRASAAESSEDFRQRRAERVARREEASLGLAQRRQESGERARAINIVRELVERQNISPAQLQAILEDDTLSQVERNVIEDTLSGRLFPQFARNQNL